MGLVQFKDAPHWAITKLRAKLPETVLVTGRMPTPIKGATVWVANDGGSRDGLRETVRLRINCFDSLLDETLDLARRVDAYLYDSLDGAPVVKLDRISGFIEIYEAGQTFHRYYSLYEVVCRGYDWHDS